MKNMYLLVILLIVAVASAGQQADPGKPGMFVGQRSESSSVVESIDQQTREVTLRHEDGSTTTIVAGPEVRNLAQVSVGDILHVKHTQTIRIQVVGAEGIEPGSGGMSTMTRAKEGEMPGMTAVDQQVLVARVVAIDLDAMTYKLQFPDGAVYEYEALVRENLEAADVGDMVAIEVTESVTAFVEDGQAGQ